MCNGSKVLRTNNLAKKKKRCPKLSLKLIFLCKQNKGNNKLKRNSVEPKKKVAT